MTAIDDVALDQADERFATMVNHAFCGCCQKHQDMTQRGHVMTLPHDKTLTLDVEICAVCGALCYVAVREEQDTDEDSAAGPFVMLDWTVDPPRLITGAVEAPL